MCASDFLEDIDTMHHQQGHGRAKGWPQRPLEEITVSIIIYLHSRSWYCAFLLPLRISAVFSNSRILRTQSVKIRKCGYNAAGQVSQTTLTTESADTFKWEFTFLRARTFSSGHTSEWTASWQVLLSSLFALFYFHHLLYLLSASPARLTVCNRASPTRNRLSKLCFSSLYISPSFWMILLPWASVSAERPLIALRYM